MHTQHMREFKRQGLLRRDPRLKADRCLVEDLKAWKAQREEIILLGDFIQSIYDSEPARTLTGPDLDMVEQFKKLHGEEASNSHMTGQLPIMGRFATSGIVVKAYFISRHHAHGSVGDHRLHVIDFCTETILGTNLPTVTKRLGRKLQWKIKSARKKHARDLTKQSKKCHLDKKALFLWVPDNFDNNEEYRLARESFEKTHCELQRCCENRCRVCRLDKMEWFPRMTEIGTRLKICKWIAGFKRGKKCNIFNLERACRNNLQNHKNEPKSKYCPWVMTLKEAEKKAAACERELNNLREEAPFLQIDHLRDMLDKAQKRGDKNKEKSLITMLWKEYDRKQNGRLRSGFGKPVSNPVSCVTLTSPEEKDQVVHSDKADTETVCSQNIVERNTAGNASPFTQGDLLETLGFMEEKSAVTEIINGAYEFPTECDERAR